MINQTEYWQAANLLVKQCGEDAPRQAARIAAESSAHGDSEGRDYWLEIMVSTKVLLNRQASE